LNKIYRVVWNTELGQWVVASEVAKGRKKKSTSGSAGTSLVLVAVAAGAMTGSPEAFAASGTSAYLDLCGQKAMGTMYTENGGGAVGNLACGGGSYFDLGIINGGSEAGIVGYNSGVVNVKASSLITLDAGLGRGPGHEHQGEAITAAGNSGSVDALMWDTNAYSASHGGTNAKIKNLAAGTVSASSNEAINGSQLYASNKFVSDTLGGTNGGMNADGTAKAPTFTVGSKTYATVGEAFAAVSNGPVGDSLNWDKDATAYNAQREGANQRITGVADAVNGNDAVSKKQLDEIVGGSKVGPDGMITKPTYTIDGKETTGTLADGISALDGRIDAIDPSGSVALLPQAGEGAGRRMRAERRAARLRRCVEHAVEHFVQVGRLSFEQFRQRVGRDAELGFVALASRTGELRQQHELIARLLQFVMREVGQQHAGKRGVGTANILLHRGGLQRTAGLRRGIATQGVRRLENRTQSAGPISSCEVLY